MLLTSCDGKDADMDKVHSAIEDVLTSINVQDASAVYYKGPESRADGDGGYFKLDINGKEVKLEFADAKGSYRNISILGVVNASPQYMFFLPAYHEIFNVLCDGYINNDALSAEGTSEVVEACKIACIADRKTGKLYRIPAIALENGTKGVECKGKYYLPGGYSEGGAIEWTNYNYYYCSQIFEFDPASLTITGILPENQSFTQFTTNADGFIGYFGSDSEPAKVKCPGGSLKPIGEDDIYTINNTFYTADVQDGRMYRWDADGNNNMTGTEVCTIPEGLSLYSGSYLYNNVENIYLFNEGEYASYKFDGNKIVKNDVTVPFQFYNSYEKYESNSAWYHLNSSKTKLTKLSKSDYSTSTINISDYQIVDLVSNPDGADLSFTGIRYSDTMKVIGKIRADNTIVIESAQNSAQNIYNLIPLN